MQERQTNQLDRKTEGGQIAAPRKALRLWPGVVIASVLVLVRYGMPLVAPDAEVFSYPLVLIAIFSGMFAALAIIIWWIFFSRAPGVERLIAPVLLIVTVFATRLIVHDSIRGGMMGGLLFIYSIPVLGLALVIWAVATRRLSTGVRRASLLATILLACAPWTLLRTAGSLGAGSEFHWRWTPTPEQVLLAQASDEPKPLPAAMATPEVLQETPAAKVGATPAVVSPTLTEAKPTIASPVPIGKPADWPGFRGPKRDGIVRGVRIKTDWSAAPPVEVWRRPIGPGWSSFAVYGDLLYTQEQRGDDEIIACYKVSTGEPVWRHRDAVRFWESNGGAGPRATPTLHKDRVYAFGATGILNALDARTGKAAWSRNVATETGRNVPIWGFASSPLVIEDVIVVAAEGTLAAYDLTTGNPRWQGPSYGGSYSSPHRATLGGVTQIVLLGGPGALSVAPADGTVFWEHKWEPGAIVQPGLTADGDILVNTLTASGGLGLRRLHVNRGAEGWRVAERWTSTGLKPYFNDFVIHKDHAYGFDGNILSCIELNEGKRKWKGGRYGNGQLVLLADQDLLLVLSEEGELALVNATPDQFTEQARFRALDGKTWNHPVVVGDLLLTRNGEQMAAFRLPVAANAAAAQLTR